MSATGQPWLTTLGAVVLCLQIAWLWPAEAPPSPITNTSYPAETAGRIFDRHLEVLMGLDSEPHYLTAFTHFLYGEREGVESRAVAAYREVLTAHDKHGKRLPGWSLQNTRARLLVVLGETGRLSRAEPVLADLARDLEGQTIAHAIAFAYLRDHETEWDDFIDTGIRLLPDGWTTDVVRLRVSARIGDIPRLNWVAGRLANRSHDLRMRHVFWSAVTAALMIFGAFSLVLAARRKAPVTCENPLSSPPMWSTGRGYAVLVWSAVFGISILVATNIFTTGHSRPFYSNILALWPTLFGSIPMIWLLVRFVLRPNGLSLTNAFGLFRPRSAQWPWLLGVAAAVFLLEKSGGLALSWLAWSLKGQPHWTEHMAHALVWGSDLKRVLSSIELLVWAPILEELGFRGLLYLTLRRHCSAATAAITASAVFAVSHAYSLSGLLSVFWGGLVFSLAVEKTRTLLPVIIAHCLGNAVFIGFTLSVYR